MSIKNNLVLCISGLDPSAGAGILADIKAIETTGSYAMGIITANTTQTENKLFNINWVKTRIITSQLQVLLDNYKFKAIKIGIIKNFRTLEKVLTVIHNIQPEIPIIWDPVIKSSSGKPINNKLHFNRIKNLLPYIKLITPNIPEFNKIFDKASPQKVANNYCPLLLKGGHSNNSQIIDTLYINNSIYKFEGVKSKLKKHGTGCTLSSLITGHIAQDKTINTACKEAKLYINKYIESDQSLLGKHTYNH